MKESRAYQNVDRAIQKARDILREAADLGFQPKSLADGIGITQAELGDLSEGTGLFPPLPLASCVLAWAEVEDDGEWRNGSETVIAGRTYPPAPPPLGQDPLRYADIERHRARLDIIRSALENGATYGDIGAGLGITRQRVHQIVKRAGLEREKLRAVTVLPDDEGLSSLLLRARTISVRYLSDQVGVSRRAVHYWFAGKVDGLQRRSPVLKRFSLVVSAWDVDHGQTGRTEECRRWWDSAKGRGRSLTALEVLDHAGSCPHCAGLAVGALRLIHLKDNNRKGTGTE